ncbi:MAG: nuclear transport factor 2 family protein [Ignavibacteriaceae bacterium]
MVKQIIEMFTGNNHDLYSEYLSENIIWNIVGMPLIRGKSEFIKTVKSLEIENFSLNRIKNIISEREFVVVESIGHTNTQNDNSNKPAYCDIYRIENNKICELTTYIIDTTINNDD